jgi:hypothetical protein
MSLIFGVVPNEDEHEVVQVLKMKQARAQLVTSQADHGNPNTKCLKKIRVQLKM